MATPPAPPVAPAPRNKDTFGFGLMMNSVEAPSLRPGDSSVEWSVSERNEEEEDSSSSEEEEDVFGQASFMPFSDSDDDGIIFEQDGDNRNAWSDETVRAHSIYAKFDKKNQLPHPPNNSQISS